MEYAARAQAKGWANAQPRHVVAELGDLIACLDRGERTHRALAPAAESDLVVRRAYAALCVALSGLNEIDTLSVPNERLRAAAAKAQVMANRGQPLSSPTDGHNPGYQGDLPLHALVRALMWEWFDSTGAKPAIASDRGRPAGFFFKFLDEAMNAVGADISPDALRSIVIRLRRENPAYAPVEKKVSP